MSCMCIISKLNSFITHHSNPNFVENWPWWLYPHFRTGDTIWYQFFKLHNLSEILVPGKFLLNTKSTNFKGLSYRIVRITNTPTDRCITTNRIQGINVFSSYLPWSRVYRTFASCARIAKNLNFEKRCGSSNNCREVPNGRISLPNTSSERERNFRNSNR